MLPSSTNPSLPRLLSLLPHGGDAGVSLSGKDTIFYEKSQVSVDVEPLKHKDVPHAYRSLQNAFVGDPLKEYMDDVPDKPKNSPFRRKAMDYLTQVVLHRQVDSSNKVLFTVDSGAAVLSANPAPASLPGQSIDKFIDSIFGSLISLGAGYILSPEQRKRDHEFATKADDLAKQSFGERLNEMWMIGMLCTEPESQGKGFGGALVEAITAMADAEGRATILFSSKVANVGFYGLHGFVRVADVLLGDDNPTWKGAPVCVPLMVREPKQKLACTVLHSYTWC